MRTHSIDTLKSAILNAHATKGGQLLVAIAAAPGAGKSTLAEALRAALEPKAQIVAMDGYHLDNSVLRARGLYTRKGAPETFDVAGFAALVSRIQAGEKPAIPGFDRAADAVVEDMHQLGDEEIILVEGNYLMLDETPWRDLHGFWDLRIWIDVPFDELRRRLIERWLTHGMEAAAAQARAEGNDLPNARRVIAKSIAADIVYEQA